MSKVYKIIKVAQKRKNLGTRAFSNKTKWHFKKIVGVYFKTDKRA